MAKLAILITDGLEIRILPGCMASLSSPPRLYLNKVLTYCEYLEHVIKLAWLICFHPASRKALSQKATRNHQYYDLDPFFSIPRTPTVAVVMVTPNKRIKLRHLPAP